MVLVAACGPAAPVARGTGTAGAPTASGSSATDTQARADRSAPGTAQPATAQASAGQPCDPRLIGPIAASFVSAMDGYLLGITLSGCAVSAAAKIVLRETTDGGRHWTAVPAPPAPWGGVAPDGTGHIAADGVTSVLFADARDGWAYGPGLWATHDGGATWHRIDTGGRAVQRMAATEGQVLASLESCDPSDATCDAPHPAGVERTPAGGDTWRLVPGVAGAPAVGGPVVGGPAVGGPAVGGPVLAGPVLAAQAGSGFAVSPAAGRLGADVPMLTGPADGSARWVSRPLPCRPGAIALTAVTATHLLLACARLGAHPATTYLYSSRDAGAHWTRFAVLGLFDGAGTIEQAPDGTVLIAGIYDGVALSRDGGRTWTRPAAVDDSDSIQGGGALTADQVTSEEGYVIGWLGPLWITRDAGRTWAQVAVH